MACLRGGACAVSSNDDVRARAHAEAPAPTEEVLVKLVKTNMFCHSFPLFSFAGTGGTGGGDREEKEREKERKRKEEGGNSSWVSSSKDAYKERAPLIIA
jgi:hypothetical protein